MISLPLSEAKKLHQQLVAGDLEAAMFAASAAVAGNELQRLPATTDVVVAGPPGVFPGLIDGVGYRGAPLFVGCTWLHCDQLGEDQEARIAAV